MVIVRYADDFVVGFQYGREAQACLDALRNGSPKFGLKLQRGEDATDSSLGCFAAERGKPSRRTSPGNV